MTHPSTSSSTPYNKNHPFLASVIDRYSLCNPGSEKSVHHVVLDIKGSGITYKVGDSMAIFPQNDPEVVEKTLAALKATGDERVNEKHTQQEFSLRELLTKKMNLAEVPRKLINEIAQKQTNPAKKEHLSSLTIEGQKEALKEYQAKHEVWDTLAENLEVTFSPQEFCLTLMPLLPRFYSIASSMEAVGDEVHLTVAELIYETNGYIRRGVCTHYLCQLTKLNETPVPVYLHPSDGFTLPEDGTAPVIMIGPGTGVAPFRGFMQERQVRGDIGINWLFFGERHRDFEFFYEEYWKDLVEKKQLRLLTAFSRDQEHKVYVQHRMMEHGKEFFDLIEQGAYIYVCGDAHRMAKDVDAALHQIIQKYGQCDEQSAKDYVKKLKTSKRYLRDIY